MPSTSRLISRRGAHLFAGATAVALLAGAVDTAFTQEPPTASTPSPQPPPSPSPSPSPQPTPTPTPTPTPPPSPAGPTASPAPGPSGRRIVRDHRTIRSYPANLGHNVIEVFDKGSLR